MNKCNLQSETPSTVTQNHDNMIWSFHGDSMQLKSSSAISDINVESVSDISQTVSLSIMRGCCQECYVWTLYLFTELLSAPAQTACRTLGEVWLWWPVPLQTACGTVGQISWPVICHHWSSDKQHEFWWLIKLILLIVTHEVQAAAGDTALCV
jgi:hypothetical protein